MHSVRIWNGQVIKCDVVRTWWLFILVSYRVKYIDIDFDYEAVEKRWYPKWRITNMKGKK